VGERSENISEAQCIAFYYLCKEQVMLQKNVAEYFDISEKTVSRHVNGKCSHNINRGTPTELYNMTLKDPDA